MVNQSSEGAERPPGIGRIPPHRSDAGAYLLAECFGCATMTLIKDVDGLYERDPKEHPGTRFIDEITVAGPILRMPLTRGRGRTQRQ